MKTSDFDYELPPELIAQEPAAERDGCRLLVMDRVTGELEDRIFRDIVDYLRPNDLLVVNETRVMPAPRCSCCARCTTASRARTTAHCGRCWCVRASA